MILQEYPIGGLIYPHHINQRMLTAPESSLEVLGAKPLKEDRYLARLTPILDRYYTKIALMTYSLVLRVDSADCEQVEVTAMPTDVKFHIIGVIEIASHAARQEQPIPDLKSVHTEKIGYAFLLLGYIMQHSDSLVDYIESQLEFSDGQAAKSLSEGTVKSLRDLKSLLIDLAKFVEVILSRYTYSFKGTNLPDFEKVVGAQHEILRIVKHLKAESLSSLFPHRFKEAHPEHVLCSILGLQASCADMLRDVPEDGRSHQTDEYWLLNQLEHNWTYKVLECEERLSTYQELVMLGFTQSRAELLAKCLDEDPIARDHQTTLYWAEQCIQDAFKYDILLNSAPRYPYGGDDHVGVWSKQEISTDDQICSEEDEVMDGVASNSTVRYINLFNRNDTSYTTRDEVQYPQKSDGHSIFFHTTDHASAVDIVENGINVNAGSRHQDFTDGGGFYLNCDFNLALDFCRRKAPPAIIVFKVPNDMMAQFTELDLRPAEHKGMWSKIVCLCRKGRRQALPSSHSEADYVQGPVCTNPTDAIRQRGRNFIPKGFGRDQYQVCIKKEEMAKAFGDIRNVDGVLFF